jgi:hypothetical protein
MSSMFTPHHSSRPEDAPGGSAALPSASRLPSGTSSLLFPSSARGAAGRSPMLNSSPAAHSVPFTMQTPSGNLGLGESLMGAGAKTPFSAFGTPAQPHPVSSNRQPFGGATGPRTGFGGRTPAATSGAAVDERPPLHSLLDAGGPQRATNAAAAAAAATAAATSTAAPGAAAAAAATPMPSRAPASRAPGGDGLWVTAFGFHSASMIGAVLDELRPSGGEIVQHSQGDGAWVHVRYADVYQLQQALAKNGKVVHGFMMGVVEGIHPSGGLTGGGGGLGLGAIGPGAAIPLRLQQARPGVGPALRAPPLARAEHGKAGWWTRICEYVFGW